MKDLNKIGEAIKADFRTTRRVLSFSEYLDLARADPRRQARSAALYARDMFDFYGHEDVPSPEGTTRRFKLFDAPWDDGEGRLVGEETVQNAIYRILNNFVRQRIVDRFILLHGPNGSSKSTITDLIARAMEHYSTLDEGAIYRFSWVFPSQKIDRAGIGFAGERGESDPRQTYAYLEDESIDARLSCDLDDHPLLLIPQAQRQEMFADIDESVEGDCPGFVVSDYLLKGDLCHKCKQVYEALLTSYQGDFLKVLRHIQVERFFVSRRYRQAVTRVEPQFAVDAKAQQVTADRSLTALPTALQNTNLYEMSGDLVQANRGLIDYPDLLKRPIDAFKYLITTVEDGRVVLDQTNLFFDLLFIGSTNDLLLNAFKESPEWMSFKGRMEIVAVPYLLDHVRERQIYEQQINEERVGKHIAPHASAVAAVWAVLTRMHQPSADNYDGDLGGLVSKLSPMEKAEIYASKTLPREVKGEDAKALRMAIPQLWAEGRNDRLYEGAFGASPREVKTAIMNAAQNTHHGCLSPTAVLEQIGRLVKETTVYAFLQMEIVDGYYDHEGFIAVTEKWLLEQIDHDVQAAMGLVEAASYEDLFTRYMDNVTHFVRQEKIQNSVTGDYEDPDPALMAEVETELGVSGDFGEFRQSLMTKIGAWSIENQGEKLDYIQVFPDHFERLRDTYFSSQTARVTRILKDSLQVLNEEGAGVPADRRKHADGMIENMASDLGYCDHCMKEAISLLLRERYA